MHAYGRSQFFYLMLSRVQTQAGRFGTFTCLSRGFFSVALTKCCDRDNLQKEGFSLAYGSRRGESPLRWGGGEVCGKTSNDKQETEKIGF